MENFKEMSEVEFNALTKNQYVKIDSNIIKNKLKTLLKGNNTLLLYLWLSSHIAREELDTTEEYPLKKQFYDKGLLACISSVQTIMDLFNISRRTVFNNIKKMEELGWLYIDKIKSSNEFKIQNVYVLSEWKIVIVNGEKKYIEILYFNN